jgi:hypothetical protein
MKNSRVALMFATAIGLVVGAGMGWVAGRRSLTPTRGYEVRTRTILTDPDGRPIGELAPGVIVVTSEPLDPGSELGWWGYVPVAFGTGSEAARMMGTSARNVASPVTVTVRALLPADLPARSE